MVVPMKDTKRTIEKHGNGIIVKGFTAAERSQITEAYNSYGDFTPEGDGFKLSGLFGVSDLVIADFS